MMKGVTLRGLEVFEALAATGSVAGAAARTKLSQPAVSQQLRNLETALGAELVDHGRRPMHLTQAGHSFVARTRRVLGELRLAQSELTVMDLSHLSTLSLGIIDDFDNDLTPRLVTTLAESMARCTFRLITAPSHEIAAAISKGDLNLAIAASPDESPGGLTEYPLIRDPFVLAVPKGSVPAGANALSMLSDLPFLRYDRAQLIGRQIERHLARHKLTLPERFEISSNPTLMAMIAAGIGWAITTPLGFLRAARFHDDIDIVPLPTSPFGRRISLLASSDWIDTVPRDVAKTAQQLLQTEFIGPAQDKLPWLRGKFELDIAV